MVKRLPVVDHDSELVGVVSRLSGLVETKSDTHLTWAIDHTAGEMVVPFLQDPAGRRSAAARGR